MDQVALNHLLSEAGIAVDIKDVVADSDQVAFTLNFGNRRVRLAFDNDPKAIRQGVAAYLGLEIEEPVEESPPSEEPQPSEEAPSPRTRRKKDTL